MDVLIFIGSTSAFLYSLIGWIIFNNTPQVYNFMFFETCATIITLVLLGNLLEHNSIKKTTSSISDLSKMQHTIAKREVDGLVEEIKIDETKVNDILIVNTGDIVPIDGILKEESLIIEDNNKTFFTKFLNKKFFIKINFYLREKLTVFNLAKALGTQNVKRHYNYIIPFYENSLMLQDYEKNVKILLIIHRKMKLM